ncbi:Rv3235 family protein [Streptomyces monomycini]|uniref:Rv3235 family protein n=1 Tax=Streptomyces monomycini TaxID=371720 RepID=UPI0004AB2C35|nr:Rv3235 family protein [Streptomyces monomycini]
MLTTHTDALPPARTRSPGASPAAGPGRPRTGPPGRRDTRRPGGPRTAPAQDVRRRPARPQPHNWFAEQLLLTLSGRRPVHALLGHALPAAYDRLVELAPQTPLRPTGTPANRYAPAPSVLHCGLCRPRPGVIEAFARIASGERLRALAFRLELGSDARWRCAAVDIGPSDRVW